MKKTNTRKPIGDEAYQKVAYIGLRNQDGSYLLNVPLYVKVSQVNINGMTDMQEELIHRISEIMIHRYEKQISEEIKKHLKGNPSKC
jgi:hypothetical protein